MCCKASLTPVRATRQVAVAAINDAISAGGKQLQTARANEDLAGGDSDVAAGQFGSGIEHYREAWKHALKAVNEN